MRFSKSSHLIITILIVGQLIANKQFNVFLILWIYYSMCPCVRYAVSTILSAQKRPLKIYYYAVGLLENRTNVRNILASIRSGWNHITCATNQESNTYSAFVLPNCEIQKIFTLALQVFVEKEILAHRNHVRNTAVLWRKSTKTSSF